MSDPVKDLIDFIDEAQFHQSGDEVVFNWPELRARVDALRAGDDGEFRAKGQFFTVGGEWYRRDDVVKVEDQGGAVMITVCRDSFIKVLRTRTTLVGVLHGLA